MNRRVRAAWGVGVVLGIFVLGLVHLFRLRFAAGDTYPVGSSRRSDPRGMRALHDSLAALPDCTVQRNHQRLSRTVPDGAGHTLFLLGYDAGRLAGPVSPDVVQDYDAFARAGGRLVLALGRGASEAGTNAWSVPNAGSPPPEGRPLGEAWGFRVTTDTSAVAEAVHDGSVPSLSTRIPWAGLHRFEGLDPAWRVIYARDGEAVVMERALGRGTLVVLGDDGLLGNEALRHRREVRLLAWLAGGNRRFVFDEAHLGLAPEPGLMGLVQRYRLGGAAIGLLILAGLYLWRQAFPFLPRRRGVAPEAGHPAVVSGRDAADGFRNLIRRTVPTTEQVPLLFDRWRANAGRRAPAERLRDAQDLLNLQSARDPRRRDPVGTFRRLCELLNPPSR